MDSLCNYGSDDERSQPKSSYNAPSDWQTEQDVNYEPVTMDMSEDSNEEEYYARKYGKYDDVAAAAQRRSFDPYEDDVSDAPTSPEPDPPTGSHVRDPSNGSAHDTHEAANQSRGYEHDERDRANQNREYEQDRANQNQGFNDRANHREDWERNAANQNRDYRREEDREEGSTNQDRDYREGGVKEAARQYGSYYERAKQKLSGEETEETDGDDRGHQNGKSSEKAGGFPTYKGDTRRSHHDRDRSRRDRSRDREHKSSKHSSSRHRDKSRDRERDKDRRHEKERRKRSRSRSRDKNDRKSSRRHRSRSRSHSRSRSSSKSRSHHAGSSSRHRRGHSSSSRRRSREPSIGDLPRPYAPYERKPSKLQILEKLGIELKVPPSTQAPPTSGGAANASAHIPSLLGINTVNPLTGQVGQGLLGAAPTGVTPQDVLQKTIAAQMEKIKADTGIELPKYYNPMAINPSKYAEQIQKRRLLWGNKVSAAATAPTSSAPAVSVPVSTPAAATAGTGGGTIWQGATFSGDRDGRMTSKFQRLMGIKNATGAAASTPSADAAASSSTQPAASKASAAAGTDLIRKQEEMFHSMENQYEAARMATHTHRGLGLGFGTFAPR